MQMMVNDGSLGVKQPMQVMPVQGFCDGASKNWLMFAQLLSQNPTNHQPQDQSICCSSIPSSPDRCR
jgi:hypothetical protein